MPTQQEVQNMFLSAQLKMANLLDANSTDFSNGFLGQFWGEIRKLNFFIKAVVRQYNMGDFTSSNFLSAYDCLCKLVGLDVNGATVDPNSQSPNTIIIINGTPGTIVNSNKIPFTNTTNVSLLNYNTAYKSIYGNNPILAIYVTGYTQDEQTPPTITYQGNDITKDILSIVWSYPVAVSGYIQITGTP